jgi:hypothetical protein
MNAAGAKASEANGLVEKGLAELMERPAASQQPFRSDAASPTGADTGKSADLTPRRPTAPRHNAALSGRGPMRYQKTPNSLPAVRLNA